MAREAFDKSKDICLQEFDVFDNGKATLITGIYSYNGGDPRLRFQYVSSSERKFIRMGKGLNKQEAGGLHKVMPQIIKAFNKLDEDQFIFFIMEDEGKKYLATKEKLRKLFDSKSKFTKFKKETKLKRNKDLMLWCCKSTKANEKNLTELFRKVLKKAAVFKKHEEVL